MKAILSIACLVILTSCGSESPTKPSTEACKRGTPTAIFPDSSDYINSHHFEIKGQDSRETFSFNDSLRVAIEQSGCEKVVQKYSFFLVGDYKEGNLCELAAEMMYELGGVDPASMPFFDSLTKEIGLRAEKFPDGGVLDLDEEREMEVLKTDTKNGIELVVILKEK